MWKYLGYAGIILPVLGATYGGLQIAADLERKLNDSFQMAEEAHKRIGDIEGTMDFEQEESERKIKDGLERLSMALDNNKMLQESKVEGLQRELLELQRVLTTVEGTTQTLEKNSFTYVTRTELDSLRELIYQVRDSNMSQGDNTQMLFELQRQIEDINRRIDEHNHGNWN